jgi:hypothetical protein
VRKRETFRRSAVTTKKAPASLRTSGPENNVPKGDSSRKAGPDQSSLAQLLPVVNLEIVRTGELPSGQAGNEVLVRLGELETAIKILRRRYKDHLQSDPDAVPGWALRTDQVRRFYEVAEAFKSLWDQPALQEVFLDSCRVSLTELELRLQTELALRPDQVLRELNRLFGESHIRFEPVTRLVRLSGFRAWQQIERLEGGAE